MFAVTERLLLRPGWAEDAPALYTAFSDEAVTMMLAHAPWPYRLKDAEAYLTQPRAPGEANFLIFDRHRGSSGLIGGVGIHDQSGQSEIGFWIARDHWGKGYATEAARAAVQIACHTLRLNKLVSGHFSDNPASGAVLQKLGFRATGRTEPRECRARGTVEPLILFERDLTTAKGTNVPAAPAHQMQMMLAA